MMQAAKLADDNLELARFWRAGLFWLVVLVAAPTAASGQENNPAAGHNLDSGEAAIDTPEKIEVDPIAEDSDISSRLARIYQATGWFDQIEVTADQGVVFLSGKTDSQAHRQWAERVAQRTSDVVAVVNNLRVPAGPVWDVDPAIGQLRQLARDFVQLLPLLAAGAIVLLIAFGLAKLSAAGARYLTSSRIESQLLQQVIASIAGVLVMLIGSYVALKVSGLSRLAVTVLGGTGLVGLALGFAFRDIAENYLASILISLNRPFRVGDLIQLDQHKGFIRRVTTRGTVLLTIDGNHIQIPNSTVYKSVITNYSSSPRIRIDFVVGIGYDDPVSRAQEIILQILESHESVLEDPRPLVLVDSLGAATVNLRSFFWLDRERFDALSVNSALMRQTKTALAEANISMPDEAREVVFPHGVPVAMLDGESEIQTRSRLLSHNGRPTPQDTSHVTNGEGSLQSTDREIQRHAAQDEVVTEENLIA